MLIYNFQKEFLGIDEKDLRALGFQNLQGLLSEVHDFSDLFVKTPGYVHNFKHVHWIDFITCAESNEESKVIINVNNKNFTATVHITNAFLVDNPESEAFLVSLNNLRELTAKESEKISGDIVQRETSLGAPEAKKIFNTPINEERVVPDPHFEEETPASVMNDPYETPLDINMDDEPLEIAGFKEEETIAPVEEVVEESSDRLDIDIEDNFDNDLPLEIDIEDDIIEVVEEKELKEKAPTPSKHIEIVEETFDNGYVYDPSVASDELGLPLDLIEEFIQDFIEQAKEFKDELYKYLNENDLENLRVLSHKLKGVAANLRIEDALETITIVNTDSNINLISENLDTFYKIIAKLAGETIKIEKEVETVEETEIALESADDSLYSDPVEINDNDVPEKISMPELADDTFEETPLHIDLELNEPTPEIEMEEEAPKLEIELDAPTPEIEMEEETPKLEIELDAPTPEIEMEEETPKLEIELDAPTPEIEIEEEAPKLEIELDAPTPEIEIEEEAPKLDYSMEEAANAIGLDLESFQELFEDYIQETQELSDSMKQAIQKDDFETIQAEAVKFKGMSDNMRVELFTNDIETLLHSKDTQEINKAINAIDSILDKLSNKGV